jgi:hypothetical protein
MDWGEFLNTVAQNEVMKAVSPKPETPVAVAQGGVPYVEGKPVASLPAPSEQGKIFGMPKMVVYGGAAVALVGLFLMLRK